MHARKLTVSLLYRESTFRKRRTSTTVTTASTTASLRLSGKWLEQAGFQAGQVVLVQVEPGKLVITHSI